MTITRRLLAAGSAALPFAAHAQAQWPERAVQIVLPYPPGNAIDLLVRALAAQMTPLLGQSVVVLNRAGAAAVVGSVSVMRAPADGYTLLFVPALVASVLPATQPQSGLQVNSFIPVCQTFSNSMALVVRPESSFRTLRDLQAAARARPAHVTYGTLGVTSIPHLAMVQWAASAGVEVEHVPFNADGVVMTEVLAGRIDVGSIVLGSAAGRNDLRVLAVFDAQRHPDWPDAPTAREQGFDVLPASFGGIFAPAGTPEPILARIEQACTQAAQSEPYRTAARTGSQPPNYFLGRADFARRLQQDIDDKAAVLRNIRLN
ncbi:MAG: tripartite tricarboxylate transporter substrate binding protein [Alphaproteobacteria bacterium]|nr:tripartite tricarboxylate transporter substrate binding protein [Alphaproteobacteria bacterium]